MTERVDLANCDREPIHVPGAIQSFGFLLAVGPDWAIARVSENVPAFLGRAAQDLHGASLADVFAPAALHKLRNMAANLRGPDAVERAFAIELLPGAWRFDLAVHFSGQMLVIEAEPSQPAPSDAASLVRRIVSRVQQVETMQQFLQEGARQVRAVSGFDRVMVYRFDSTGAGEVVAEARAHEIDSFLGLHYPASDIPAQARTLYLRNIFRVIADVGADPVRLSPQFDAQGEPLDLSLSILRAVSPIHIEYLKNMGVEASMSISIVVEGKLWGLFACHHYKPRLPGFFDRTVAELFGSMFSLMLESRERAASADYENRARALSDRVLTAIAHDATRLGDAEWLASVVADAIPCDGVGVSIAGETTLSGMTPNLAQFRAIVSLLERDGGKEVVACDSIAAIIPEAESYAARAAGFIAIPVSRQSDDYVVLFRAEQLQAVRWAGNPAKPLEFGPNGARLTPRKSFEEWSSLVRNKAVPFTAAERRVAEALRSTLLEIVLRLAEETVRERERADERQSLLIAELNHRVRNILSLVRGLLHQSRGSGAAAHEVIEALGDRILSLARAHDQITESRGAPTSLRSLVDTEAAAFLGARKARFEARGPDVLLQPDAFTSLALVVHELVTNASKYGALSDSGRVAIDWRVDDVGALDIAWRETGGPIVRPPQREGFGSALIRRSIPHDLAGKADVRFALTGLEADFHIPARHVVTAAPAPEYAPVSAMTSAATRPLESRSVLLCEDSLLIAMDCETLLAELGADKVLTASSGAQARALIAERPIDIAVLDLNLGAESSLPIAEELQRRGVPFIFATGYGQLAALGEQFACAPVVTKPYSREDLAQACARALAAPSGDAA